MKNNVFYRTFSMILVLAVIFSFASIPVTANAAETEEEYYGMIAIINGEKAIYTQADAFLGKSTGLCTFIDMDAGNTAPSIGFTFDPATFGRSDTVKKPSGVAWDSDAPFYFKYQPDLVALSMRAGRSPYLSLDKEDEWELTILSQEGTVYEGTLEGTFNNGKYTIVAYFVMNTDETVVETMDNPAYQLFDRLFGTPSDNIVPVPDYDGSKPKPNTCGVCGGNGKCHTCKGSGRVFNSSIFVNAYKECSICHGDGICNGCGGKGHH